MTNPKAIREAKPHIENAKRSLEMLEYFIQNRAKLSLAKHMPNYLDTLFDSVLELQRIILTDQEYTDRVYHGLKHVSRKRELGYNITTSDDGDTFCAVNGLLPVKELKGNVLFSGKIKYDESV